eukprot:745819-Hanusia_phi.AAC.3
MGTTRGALALCLTLLLPRASLQSVRLRLLDDPLARLGCLRASMWWVRACNESFCTFERCLDGSSGGFYFRPSQLASKKKSWIIHLQGGTMTRLDARSLFSSSSLARRGMRVGRGVHPKTECGEVV